MKTLGITAKLVFHSAWILTALGAAVTLYSVSQLRALLHQEMVQRVEAQTLNWIEANTSQIILSGDPQTLDRLVGELKSREGIAYVVLLDAQGRRKAAVAVRKDLRELQENTPDSDNRMRWREMQDADGLRYFELVASISASGTGMSPDLGTLFGAAADNPTWGELRVGVDRQQFDRGVNALVRKNIVLAAVLISVAIGLSFVFAKRMVTPITLMGKVANQIAAGSLSERVHQGDNLRDEVGDLVRNFNHMALRLEENREEMNLLYSRLEEKVRERTKELEQANRKLKELDQLKSDFLSTVSHELRTPLTSIKAYAEILIDSPHLEPATEEHFLDIIDKETNRMSRLISDLLNLEKIESGTTSWTMSNFDLREVIRTSAAVLAPSAAEKRIHLRLHISEPQPVSADPDRVQEVITNLIGNGIKFCSHGGHIEIRLRRSTTSGPDGRLPGDYVRVEVTDDGPGIQPDERLRVFEKFYQGTRNGSDGSGSGLGLAISKEIVLHYKGEIWLDSQTGVGSSFYFTLPLRPTAPAVQTRTPEPAEREA
jgi:signal transduction histidine kinase